MRPRQLVRLALVLLAPAVILSLPKDAAGQSAGSTQRPIPEGFRLGQVAGHLTWGMTDRDSLELSAGRGHTPTGYWNTAFNHGQWLQSPIGRPEMVRPGNAPDAHGEHHG